MKKGLLCILSLIAISVSCFAQSKFEKGYFVDNKNVRSECLIKTNNSSSNPSSFEYKLLENSKVFSLSVSQVKEFAVSDYLKYVSCEVDVDRSSEVYSHLTFNKRPLFKKERLFLKQIVDGKANLYYYKDNTIVRFFYNLSDSKITQLVYKKYKIDCSKLRCLDKVAENKQYLQQLVVDLRNEKYSIERHRNIKYKKRDLVKYFVLYNKAKGEKAYVIEDSRDVPTYNFSLKGGINVNNFNLQNSSDRANSEILNSNAKNSIGYYLGIQFEYFLPFVNNKFSILLMPSYAQSNAKSCLDHVLIDGGFRGGFDLMYRSFEMPIGFRYYVPLNEKNKMYIDGSYDAMAAIGSLKSHNNDSFYLDGVHSLYLNLGYSFSDKICVEFSYKHFKGRYHYNSELINNSYGISFSYNIFNFKK